ncbi:hypothetical protein OSB04_un001062 [Centaurea solstitialis]|uniref:Uncharacterized protein n=1 Tax=Centaurea solstitialis TaxID=347529 RepID=A0AA38S2W8_9ASTR|nr:hypothetical protein OSB04_un001062 [Centaurea solstitialis]
MLFFGNGTLKYPNLMKILQCFHIVFPRFENKFGEKSTITVLELLPEKIARVATMVGCKSGNLPFTYLGLPIGAKRKDSVNRGHLTLANRTGQFRPSCVKHCAYFKVVVDSEQKRQHREGRVVALHGPFGSIGRETRNSTQKGLGDRSRAFKVLWKIAIMPGGFLLQREIHGNVISRSWKDIWVGNCTLADRFPRITALDIAYRGRKMVSGFAVAGEERFDMVVSRRGSL